MKQIQLTQDQMAFCQAWAWAVANNAMRNKLRSKKKTNSEFQIFDLYNGCRGELAMAIMFDEPEDRVEISPKIWGKEFPHHDLMIKDQRVDVKANTGGGMTLHPSVQKKKIDVFSYVIVEDNGICTYHGSISMNRLLQQEEQFRIPDETDKEYGYYWRIEKELLK